MPASVSIKPSQRQLTSGSDCPVHGNVVFEMCCRAFQLSVPIIHDIDSSSLILRAAGWHSWCSELWFPNLPNLCNLRFCDLSHSELICSALLLTCVD